VRAVAVVEVAAGGGARIGSVGGGGEEGGGDEDSLHALAWSNARARIVPSRIAQLRLST
jgi:hypothetical protein